MGSDPRHVPVFLGRVLELLEPCLRQADADGERPVLLDGTLGLGGHAEAFLARHSDLLLIGLDRDPDALRLAAERLASFGDRVRMVHTGYDALLDVLTDNGIDHVHGMLFDLGVSSYQLDAPERGFSYSRDVELDMRMDRTQGPSAADVVNGYDATELARILRQYGEEPNARRIAEAIVVERRNHPFDNSARLSAVIHDALPRAVLLKSSGHPAKRTFQALRIEVNGELTGLEGLLPQIPAGLATAARAVVLSYHSLEDRLVKRAFRDLSEPDVPPGVPGIPPGHEPLVRLLTRGAEKPEADEIAQNPRSASARLRGVQRLPGGESRLRRMGVLQ